MWDYYEYTRVYNNMHKNFVMPLIYDESLVLCWYELHHLHLCNILNILIAMDKSEIRKMYNGDFICGKQKIEHNGIIPLICKRII